MTLSFAKLCRLVEAGPTPAPPPPGGMGGLGGPPGMGGPLGGGMPPLGGGLGGPPLGGLGGPPGMGGDPSAGQPTPVKSIESSDVWKLMEKMVKEMDDSDDISIRKSHKRPESKKDKGPSALLK